MIDRLVDDLWSMECEPLSNDLQAEFTGLK